MGVLRISGPGQSAATVMCDLWVRWVGRLDITRAPEKAIHMNQTDQLAAAFRAFIREQMAQAPATAALFVELARAVLDEATRTESADHAISNKDNTPNTIIASSPQSTAKSAAEAKPNPDSVRRTVPLRIGDISIPVEVDGTEADLRAAEAAHTPVRDQPEPIADTPDIDLAMIVRRAKLKSASCLLYIDRRAAEGDPDRERPILESMKFMIDRAQNELRECFLWAFFRERAQPSDEALREIAACYEALAEAADACAKATADEWLTDEDTLHAAMQLLAEASSALRVALRQTWLVQPDRDQDETHLWLRTEAWRRSIYVARYMSLDDPADPARAPELTAEARTLVNLLDTRQRDARRVEELTNKVRYHARQLAADPGNEHHARTINTCCDELIAKGLRPSDTRLLALSASIKPEHFPESAPPSEATASITRGPVAATARVVEPKVPPAPRQWSERVLEARELLRGGNLVLIGGEVRPDAIARITDAFALESVEWISLTEHGSGAPMQAPISRPETKAVIVLIKLAGHLHAEEARGYARQVDKPCIMLPAGYNPEQIAEHLLNQAAGRLG